MWIRKATQRKTVLHCIGTGIVAFSLISLGTSCSFLEAQTPSAQVATQPAPAMTKVVTRGKIIPQWDVIKLSVSNAQDSRVNKILVQVGDRVAANQVIAILQGADRRSADLQAAQSNVKLLRAQLAKVQQGDAKPGALAAQRAAIARLEAQLPAEKRQKEAEIASAFATLREAALTYQRRQILNL